MNHASFTPVPVAKKFKRKSFCVCNTYTSHKRNKKNRERAYKTMYKIKWNSNRIMLTVNTQGEELELKLSERRTRLSIRTFPIFFLPHRLTLLVLFQVIFAVETWGKGLSKIEQWISSWPTELAGLAKKVMQ